MLNKVMIIGRLGNDPQEIKKNGSDDIMFLKFNVATTEYYKTKEGEKKENTEWFRCVIGYKSAIEAALRAGYKKGDLLYIEGKMFSRNWTDKEGKEVNSTEVSILSIRRLLSAPNSRQEPKQETSAKSHPTQSEDMDFLDDMPF